MYDVEGMTNKNKDQLVKVELEEECPAAARRPSASHEKQKPEAFARWLLPLQGAAKAEGAEPQAVRVNLAPACRQERQPSHARVTSAAPCPGAPGTSILAPILNLLMKSHPERVVDPQRL
ncbi:hypothetical protein CALVIDRAFT_136969 [Calocera viscosa TUFC12733]|uniref:Uncharacterized protein n=1 Tax=Calocera viscosa (strain TUFC12733) TaxID=1330018 RepID=A0A167LZ64_CALVF|nr:hypothetical protein CALVIDRAFT_136969 [Calocera viscosa TUFC12733]